MFDKIQLGAVLAPIVSTAVVKILYHHLGKEYLGAEENKIWNQARKTVLGTLNQYVENRTQFTLTNRAKSAEFVGSVDMSSSELAALLESKGYLQGILSGLKLRGSQGSNGIEAGSMVYRESKSSLIPDALAFHQVHVFWFENRDGTLDVYAH